MRSRRTPTIEEGGEMTIHLDARHLTTFAVTVGLLLGACGARPNETEVATPFRRLRPTTPPPVSPLQWRSHPRTKSAQAKISTTSGSRTM